jgi:hypothetical protein
MKRLALVFVALLFLAACEHEWNPEPTTTTTTTPAPQYPDASTTGPSGTLTPSGNIWTSYDGQVIENLDVTGTIFVNHYNVTIRNVRVRTTGDGISSVGPHTGLKVSDCELDGSLDPNNPYVGIGVARYEMRRCEIKGFITGAQAWGDSVLEGNYIHSLTPVPSGVDPHREGIHVEWGQNVHIVGNTVLMEYAYGTTAGIWVSTHAGQTGPNIWVTDNLVGSAGNMTIGGVGGTNAAERRVARNAIVHFPDNTWWPPITHTTYLVEYCGNYWYDGPNAGQLLAGNPACP